MNLKYPELRKLLSDRKVSSQPIFTSLNFLDENWVRRELSPLNIASALSSASGSLIQKIRFLIYLFSKPKASLTLHAQSSQFKDLYARVLSPFLSGVFLINPDKIRGDVAHHVLRYFLVGRPRLINGGVGNLIPILMEGIPKSQLHPSSKVRRIIQHPHDQLLSLRVEINRLPKRNRKLFLGNSFVNSLVA